LSSEFDARANRLTFCVLRDGLGVPPFRVLRSAFRRSALIPDFPFPGSRFPFPDPRSAIRDPRSAIRDLGSRFRFPVPSRFP